MIATRPRRPAAHYHDAAPYCTAEDHAGATHCARIIGPLDDVRYLTTLLDLDRAAPRITWCAACLAASPELRAIVRAAAHDNTPEEHPL